MIAFLKCFRCPFIASCISGIAVVPRYANSIIP